MEKGYFPPEHSRTGKSHAVWGLFSHYGTRGGSAALVLLRPTCLIPPSEAAELGSGSPGQAIELIPISSGYNCMVVLQRAGQKWLISHPVMLLPQLLWTKPMTSKVLPMSTCLVFALRSNHSKNQSKIQLSWFRGLGGLNTSGLTSPISNKECYHTALFQRHLLDRNTYFCQQVSNNTPEAVPLPELNLHYL